MYVYTYLCAYIYQILIATVIISRTRKEKGTFCYAEHESPQLAINCGRNFLLFYPLINRMLTVPFEIMSVKTHVWVDAVMLWFILIH